MINQTDLKYFVEAAKTQHISRAAERLGITQPALSHCIKRIEAEAKISLFTRSKKGVQLTSAGQKFLSGVNDLIAKWDEVLRGAQDEIQELKGVVRFGCHSAVAQYVLPALLPDFLKLYPEISFTLTHGLSRHITEMIVSAELEIGVVVNPIPNPNLVIRELALDHVAVWRSKHCKNLDVLFCDPSLMQTQELLKKLARKEIYFKRIIESSSLEVIAQMVSSGAGHGLLPERVVRAMASTSGILRVQEEIEFRDRICLVYKPEFKTLKRGSAILKYFSNRQIL